MIEYDGRLWMMIGTTVNDCLWWIMVHVGGWLQQLIGNYGICWPTVNHDRNWWVNTVNDYLWRIMVGGYNI